MAPEIATKQEYTGDKADIFSLAVTLFTLTVGFFPFSSSKPDDQYYKYLAEKDFLGYWEAVEVVNNSKEFKDLFQRMTALDREERITIAEIKAHPWVTQQSQLTDMELKKQMAEKLNQVRISKMQKRQEEAMKEMTKQVAYMRGPEDEDYAVREQFTKLYKHSELSIWATKLTARKFWTVLDEQVSEGEQCQLVQKKGKFYLENEEDGLLIRVDFEHDAEEGLLRIVFFKKQGPIVKYYKLLKELQTLMEPDLAPTLS